MDFIEQNPFDVADLVKALLDEDLKKEERKFLLKLYNKVIGKARPEALQIARYECFKGYFNSTIEKEAFLAQIQTLIRDIHYMADNVRKSSSIEDVISRIIKDLDLDFVSDFEWKNNLRKIVYQELDGETGKKIATLLRLKESVIDYLRSK